VLLFVAVPADDVGVPSTAIAGLTFVASQAVVLFGRKAIVVGSDSSDLLNFLLAQVFPDDFIRLLWLKLSFDAGNFVSPFVIILDGLQVAGHFHAFVEGRLCGLQDLVTDAVLEANQEELMLDKLEGIRNAFSFSFLDSRSCRSDSSHGQACCQ
jgi:hypothetical protein